MNKSPPLRGWQKKPVMSAGRKPSIICPWMTEVRTMLICHHHPLHMSPHNWRQGRVEGRTSASLRYLFPQWWNSLCFSDKFYFLLLPSGAVSSAWKPSLHLVLKYIILPIQICQRLYYICISNLIKSFSGWHFFLEGNFKLNIFCLVISLSLFFQANFTLRLQITSCWERGHSPQLPSSPPWCPEGCLCISLPGPSLTENLLWALWNIFPAHISQVDCCFCWMLASEWGSSSYAPEEGNERSIPVYI